MHFLKLKQIGSYIMCRISKNTIIRDGCGKNDSNRVVIKLYLSNEEIGKYRKKPIKMKNDRHNHIQRSRVDYARERY